MRPTTTISFCTDVLQRIDGRIYEREEVGCQGGVKGLANPAPSPKHTLCSTRIERKMTVGDQKRVRITSAKFVGYKAFDEFTLRLSHMNILVGSNNNGKSTILGAFRILDLALRTMASRRAEPIRGPSGPRPGWRLAEDSLPVSAENVHTNYSERDTTIEFRLSNGAEVVLYFPPEDGCYAYANIEHGNARLPQEIRKHVPITLTVVPILGPLEHKEKAVQPETVKANLATTRASRNFRSYWLYNSQHFDTFADLVSNTWPGMTVHRPEKQDDSVFMFCDENRRARELFWSGFGFQIWLQLLTHIARSSDSTMIIVDEPELYLHPDVQRQLLAILRDAGADLLMATHSTEIMSEADPSEIVLVDKSKKNSERLRDVEGVQKALTAVGSIQNITLTRLARNRRVLFSEGESDVRLLRRFARRLGYTGLASMSDLTPLDSGGFSSWARISAMTSAFEETLGVALHVAAIFDRDYWCDEQITEIKKELRSKLDFAYMHECKEVENYLLIPSALDRAIDEAIAERNERTGNHDSRSFSSQVVLNEIASELRIDIQSQFVSKRWAFFEGRVGLDHSTVTKEAMKIFDTAWNTLEGRLRILPGKQVIARFRSRVAEAHSVNLTDHRLVNALHLDEIGADLRELLNGLDSFRLGNLPSMRTKGH